MADSLKTCLMDQLLDLHDSVVVHLDEYSPRDLLGEGLDQLRSSGTGKSLVMLALLDDLLRMTEILLAENWQPLKPDFAEFAAPFFQSAAKTFAKKGLTQYASYSRLIPATAGKFLSYHWNSTRPFGGQHQPTQWSGLQVCTNAAIKYGNIPALDGYERLSQRLLSILTKRIPQADEAQLRQLSDFVSDRCAAVREQIQARHTPPAQQDLSRERAELAALRAELETKDAQLRERERLMEEEWKRFQQERTEYEGLRQQWEEELADHTDASAESALLAADREALAKERAALLREREQLETERAELWHEREELAALREHLQARQISPPRNIASSHRNGRSDQDDLDVKSTSGSSQE